MIGPRPTLVDSGLLRGSSPYSWAETTLEEEVGRYLTLNQGPRVRHEGRRRNSPTRTWTPRSILPEVLRTEVLDEFFSTEWDASPNDVGPLN